MAIFLRKDPALHSEVRESLGVSFAPSEQSHPAPQQTSVSAYATRWVATSAPTRTRRRVRTSTRVLSVAASSVVTRQATCTSTWRAYEYPWQCSPSPAPPEGTRGLEAVLAKAALTGTETVGDVVFLLRGVGLQQEELPEGLFPASRKPSPARKEGVRQAAE